MHPVVTTKGSSLKRIQLTQGKEAIVDDDDYETLSRFKWSAKRIGNKFYAAKTFATPDGRSSMMLMHQIVLVTKRPLVIDHIDGDGLNNRRGNLREATNANNQHNTGKSKSGKTSKYKGVSWDSTNRRWGAAMRIDGRVKRLGSFHHEIDAARAYDQACIRERGEFAQHNGVA